MRKGAAISGHTSASGLGNENASSNPGIVRPHSPSSLTPYEPFTSLTKIQSIRRSGAHLLALYRDEAPESLASTRLRSAAGLLQHLRIAAERLSPCWTQSQNCKCIPRQSSSVCFPSIKCPSIAILHSLFLRKTRTPYQKSQRRGAWPNQFRNPT